MEVKVSSKVDIDGEVHEELKVYCKSRGVTVKDFVSKLVLHTIRGTLDSRGVIAKKPWPSRPPALDSDPYTRPPFWEQR